MFVYENKKNFEKFKISIGLASRLIEKLQKLIYVATKEYNIKKIGIYQKILILLRKEILLIVLSQSVHKIRQKFYLSNLYYQKLFTLSYFIIFKKLKKTFYHLRFLKAQIIKRTLLFLLSPEWLVKTESGCLLEYKKQYVYATNRYLDTISQKFTKFESKYKLQLKVFCSYKNNQNTDIIKKINANKAISKNLYLYLNSQDLTHNRNPYCNFATTKKNRLNELIYAVYLVGMEWYIYTNLRKENLYINLYSLDCKDSLLYLSSALIINAVTDYISKFIYAKSINLKEIKSYLFSKFDKHIHLQGIDLTREKDLNYRIRPSYKSVQHNLDILRYYLYRKNVKGVWKINHKTRLKRAQLLINYLNDSWNFHYISILNHQIMRNAIDTIFYLWLKKNNKR